MTGKELKEEAKAVVGVFATIVAIAALLALFAYALGEAWDYDGYAHSHEAFGTEYDCVEE